MRYESKSSNFTWNSLGNIEEGRKNLGTDMPVIVYRLFSIYLKGRFIL